MSLASNSLWRSVQRHSAFQSAVRARTRMSLGQRRRFSSSSFTASGAAGAGAGIAVAAASAAAVTTLGAAGWDSVPSSPTPTPVSAPPPVPSSNRELIGKIASTLDAISPRFDVEPGQIRVLATPADFYNTLKSKILAAKRRVFLSTLYIGRSEHELVSVLQHALRSNPDLKLSILTDALRGTRETPGASSASLLVPLVTEFGPGRVEIRMFHTPNLTGWRKRVIPKRINEGWGLQHMKLYGFDDEILLSGANLSSDYFTNRQDRYHLISSADVTDYYSRVHDSICQLSFKISPTPPQNGTGADPTRQTVPAYISTWEPTNKAPSPLDSPDSFVSASTDFLSALTRPNRTSAAPPSSSTAIYPLLQLTPLMRPGADGSNELRAMRSLFQLFATAPFRAHSWVFTAGYFNITPEFRALLLATRPAAGTVIAASPWANGFYGSAGVSGMLPAAYTHLAARFVAAVEKVRSAGPAPDANNTDLESQAEKAAAVPPVNVSLCEWRNGTVGQPGGWTYHAKGFWLSLPPTAPAPDDTGAAAGGSDRARTRMRTMPCLTVVGSSNYTDRSHRLDIEANALIVSSDPDLQARLLAEVENLQRHAAPVDRSEFDRPERRVPAHVRLAMWIVSFLGGAL